MENSTYKEICSFCGKTVDQVKILIAGPDNVFICDECVDTCADIVKKAKMNNVNVKERADVQDQKTISPEDISGELILNDGKYIVDERIRSAIDNPEVSLKKIIDDIVNMEFGLTMPQYNFIITPLQNNKNVYEFKINKNMYDLVDKKLSKLHASFWSLSIPITRLDSNVIIMHYVDRNGNSIRDDFYLDNIRCLSENLCKKIDLSVFGVRNTSYYHCRRQGWGAYEKDKYFPAITIDEVKKAMKESKPYTDCRINNRSYKLKNLNIGPYVAVKDGMYFEKNDTIFYRNIYGETHTICSMSDAKSYICVQALRIEGNKLIISYISKVSMTASNVEQSIMGDMGSEFNDIYEADTMEKVVNIVHK